MSLILCYLTYKQIIMMRIILHIRLAKLPTIKGATLIAILSAMGHLTPPECPLRLIDTTQIMMIVRWCYLPALFINHWHSLRRRSRCGASWLPSWASTGN